MGERVSYYLDEHVANAITKGLRQRGVDVLMTGEAQMIGTSDEEQLAFALSEHRSLFTNDDDFLKLHAEGFEHAGIVYARQQHLSIGEIIQGLMLIYEVGPQRRRYDESRRVSLGRTIWQSCQASSPASSPARGRRH